MHEIWQRTVSRVLAVFTLVMKKNNAGLHNISTIYWISTGYLLNIYCLHTSLPRVALSNSENWAESHEGCSTQHCLGSSATVGSRLRLTYQHFIGFNYLPFRIGTRMESGVLQITNTFQVSFSSKLLPIRNGILITRSRCSWLVLALTWT